ncbi:MAG: hypothetical protein MJ198_06560 [Bacteroidales bacterium]|nr:hypothetical protein [Bacteroidales bacterium]
MVSVQDFVEKMLQDGIQMDMQQMVGFLENGEISALDLFEIVLKNDDPQSWYASWILNHYIDKHPDALEKHLNEAVDLLPKITRTGFLRLVLRFFIVTPQWNIENLGLLFDFNLNLLTNMTMPAGVKANAMSVIERITEIEPELKEEFLLVIEEILPYLSAGGLSRAKKILKNLS